MAHNTSDYNRLPIASGNIRSSAGFGRKEDYTYDLPDGAIWASIDPENISGNTISLGSGSGKATMKVDMANKKAHVHAWVNGSAVFWAHNEVKWTVYAWMPKN